MNKKELIERIRLPEWSDIEFKEARHYRAAQDMAAADQDRAFNPVYNAVLQVTIALTGGKRNVV